MDASELRRRVDALPRLPLTELPTPLHDCARLSQRCGVRVLMKRDDLTGLALGGNKTRQFEFVLPDIVASGVDTIVAGAFVQSNWCRQLTAAAAAHGIRTELILARGAGRYEGRSIPLQGNLLLDRLLGAEVRVVDIADVHELRPFIDARVDALRREGRKARGMVTFDPGTQAQSAVAYVGGMLELLDQVETLGLEIRHVYVSGATTTPAGMALTVKALNLPLRVVSVTPIHWSESRAVDIARIGNDAARLLGLDIRLEAEDIANDGRWVGEGYDRLTGPALDAMRLVGATEGILLDPIYSARAMAALLTDAHSGVIAGGEIAIFVHTGGAPAIFAYADEIASMIHHPVGEPS